MGFELDPQLTEQVERLARRIAEAGGRAFYVGGVVRDRLLGRSPKDVDVEVYGLPLGKLQEVLAEQGRVMLVGRQFGVLRLAGLEVDWAIPRRDSAGRHPRVITDPGMSFREAGRRRDLTMNAMLQEVLTGKVVDPWNGRRDLERGVLRAPDLRLFIEDPLRFFRVMQFTARFELEPDRELHAVCARMDLGGVSGERIEEEFVKLWLEARRPSLGLRWLERVGRLGEVLPELEPMKGCPQDPEWHPEGDVWTHTLQVVDAAAALRCGDKLRDLKLIWSALCHDLGKPATTVILEGRIRTPEHDREGARIAVALLERLIHTRQLRRGVLKLVAQHMQVLQFHQNNAGEKGFKRLALRLHPEADLELLATLALADSRGTNPGSELPRADGEHPMVDWFLEQARALQVDRRPEPPVLKGRHLAGVLEPGPRMGRVLEAAYRLQLEEGLRDPEELKQRALEEVGER